MTTIRTAQRSKSRLLLLTGTGLLTMAVLTGCANNNDGAGTPTTEAPTTTEAPMASTPAATEDTTSPTTSDTATSGGTTSPSTSDTATAGGTGSPSTSGTAASGETDAVFSAIDAVLSQHSGGVITTVDREDDRDEYEIDVVSGQEVIETKVLEDGTVQEEGRDNDEDAIRDAQQAEVSAEDAIRTALEGRQGQLLNEAELDEEGGSLHWKIELDRAGGGKGDHLSIDAMTGELTQR
ncbi:MAG: PepSY domain-containing protein [Micrococcus sp.]|nr:PepSY domain-containing protein [Micrococcus sp.]